MKRMGSHRIGRFGANRTRVVNPPFRPWLSDLLGEGKSPQVDGHGRTWGEFMDEVMEWVRTEVGPKIPGGKSVTPAAWAKLRETFSIYLQDRRCRALIAQGPLPGWEKKVQRAQKIILRRMKEVFALGDGESHFRQQLNRPSSSWRARLGLSERDVATICSQHGEDFEWVLLELTAKRMEEHRQTALQFQRRIELQGHYQLTPPDGNGRGKSGSIYGVPSPSAGTPLRRSMDYPFPLKRLCYNLHRQLRDELSVRDCVLTMLRLAGALDGGEQIEALLRKCEREKSTSWVSTLLAQWRPLFDVPPGQSK